MTCLALKLLVEVDETQAKAIVQFTRSKLKDLSNNIINSFDVIRIMRPQLSKIAEIDSLKKNFCICLNNLIPLDGPHKLMSFKSLEPYRKAYPSSKDLFISFFHFQKMKLSFECSNFQKNFTSWNIFSSKMKWILFEKIGWPNIHAYRLWHTNRLQQEYGFMMTILVDRNLPFEIIGGTCKSSYENITSIFVLLWAIKNVNNDHDLHFT